MARKIRLEYGSPEVERKMMRLMRLGTFCSYLWLASLATALALLYFTTTIGEFTSRGIQTVLLNHPLVLVSLGAFFFGVFAENHFRSKANDLANGNDVRIYEQ